MFYLQHRKLRKEIHLLLKVTRRLLRFNRDLLEPNCAQEVATASNQLAAAMNAKNVAAIHSCREKLAKQIEKTFPSAPHAGLRENVEVLLVAVIVAMGIRTFFVQPFKIPTGSMQPTLYGLVRAEDYVTPPSIVKRLYDSIVTGKWPRNPRSSFGTGITDFFAWAVFGTWPDDGVSMMGGDHIFVERLTYHFCKPRRGDVVVFGTSHVPNPGGAFYIKRLVGLPRDVLKIDAPHLLVNGQILEGRTAFRRIYSMRDGYDGYQSYTAGSHGEKYYGIHLDTQTSVFQVPERSYFVLGDNTLHSKDGRYWGSFPREDIIGRAFYVYWPFSGRFGLID